MQYAIKAILIDLDGTLVDTAPEIARAANQMLANLGFETQSEAQITGFIGEGALALISKCLQTASNSTPDDALLKRAKPLFFDCYQAIVTESQPYLNAVSTVQSLRSSGFKMACITNKPQAFTMPLLAKTGLLPFFNVVVSGDSLPQKKPDPAPLLYACAQLGVAVHEAIMVGDSRTDMLAAHHANCPILVVKNGYTQGKPIDAQEVDGLLDDFAEIEQQVLLKH